MEKRSSLTNLQEELLKVFSYDLPEEELKDIKQLLVNYFSEKTTEEMEKLWSSQSIDQSTIESWSKEHMRTRYER